MTKKRTFILSALLLIFITAACQAEVELQPAQPADAAATAVPSNTPTIEDIINTPILEPVTPAPATTDLTEETTMPTETAPPTPETPAAEPAESKPDETSAQPAAEPAHSAAIQAWIDQAKEDLAQRQSAALEEIELLSYEDKVWSDSSLGCPQPGMRYLQVLKEGYLIRLRIGQEIYNYHGGEGRDPFLCEQAGPPIVITKQAPLDIKQTPTKSVPPPRD